MGTKVDFLYLSEPDMVKAGVKDMKQCVEVMERLLVTLNKGDYVMGGKNHNSHGCMIMFPDDPQFPGMPKNADERRFMAMPDVCKSGQLLSNWRHSRRWCKVSGTKGCKNGCHCWPWCYGKDFSGSFRQRLSESGYPED